MATSRTWLQRIWGFASKWFPPLRNARLIAKYAPWLVAAAILAFVFLRSDLTAVWASLQTISYVKLAALSTGFAVCLCMVDSLALFFALRVSLQNSTIRYRDVVKVRGASMLFGLLNFGAGQAGIIYYLTKRFNVPVFRATGAILLGTGCFLLCVALFVGGAFFLGALPEYPQFKLLGPLVFVGLAIYFILLKWQPNFLTRWSLFQPLFHAGIKGTLLVLCGRALHLSVLVLFHWGAMNLFGIQTPLVAAFAAMPVIFLVAQIPISPAGLGTMQAAAITLLSGFVVAPNRSTQESTVLAYSMGFQLTSMVAIACVGIICLKWLQYTTENQTIAGK